MRLRRRTKKWIAILLGLALVAGIGLSIPQVRHWLRSLGSSLHRHHVPEMESVVIDHSLRLRKDLYPLHRAVADRHGLPLMQDEEDIHAAVMTKDLVWVKARTGYIIGDLTHSKPALHPKAYEMLQLIGHLYEQEAGKRQHLTVTSLTRTMGSQKKLVRSNRNATRDISTHCYGISFDISYVRFNGIKVYDAERKRILSAILATLQQQGRIYVTEERKVACYHITARW